MRRLSSILMLSFVAVCLVTTSQGFAAGTSKMTYSESYAEKLYCERIEGESYCDYAEPKSKFSLSGSIAIKNDGGNSINENTEFWLYINNYWYVFSPSDDPTYYNGKNNFTVLETEYDPNGNPIILSTIVGKWSKDRLNFSIKGVSYDSYNNPVFCDNYLYSEPGRFYDVSTIITGMYTDTTGYSELYFDLVISGNVKLKTLSKPDGDWELWSVSLKGKGAPQAP